MKLLFISPSFYPAFYYGGPIYSTYSLALNLSKAGNKISVLTTDANGKHKLDLVKNTFIHYAKNFKVKYYLSVNHKGFSINLLINAWRHFKTCDLIYLISVFSFTTPYTLFFSNLYKKKIVIAPMGQLNNWCINQGSKFKRLWLQLFIKPFLGSIIWHLASHQEENMLKEVYPSALTVVLPHGIESTECDLTDEIIKDRNYFAKFTSKPIGKYVLVSLGRYHKVKGFDILINSVELLKSQNISLSLFIAGEDYGEKGFLKNLIDKKSLNDTVFLLNHLNGEEKKSFLSNADLFVLASHSESFGMVYLEALAVGTPVIASKNTPWQEVEENDCGRYVVNSPEKIAAVIQEMINSDLMLKGKNGIKLVKDRYLWESITESFNQKFKSIL